MGSGTHHDDLMPWGPAMSALTDLQRRYVLAMQFEPLGHPVMWARMAGYADNGKSVIRVTAHQLSHNPDIRAAVEECARATVTHVGPLLGIAVMLKIARDSTHPKQLAAAIALANRSGFHETTEHVMHVQHTDRTGAAMIERITELAGELGLDAAKLLGANAPKMKVIEHKEQTDAGARPRQESGAGEAGARDTDARPAADREIS